MASLTLDRPAPPPAQRRDPRRTRRLLSAALLYTVLVVAAAAIMLPFFWMVVSSLKNNNQIFTVPVQWLPDPAVWQNYLDIWDKSEMSRWLRTTLLLSITVTLLQLFTGSFAAYGFAKMRFPGRDVLFLAYIGTIAVPWQAYMIPQFILMTRLGLSNTLWAMVALQAFGAFGVFLMKQFYESIPEELSEAARIDGLSEYAIWWRIVLPLSGPALATLALLTFVNTWNDYLGPLIYLRNPDIWTIQIGLRSLVSQYNAEYALIMTGSVLSVLPIAIIFLLGQRYFVQGIATSGLKG
ncbi:carbohydrate ABC transporter permease [Sanguibacter antarcticus]|uniref:Carbohydrate ABC transporter membrane protein 2 (CUT1 family) n=1 Tax=Sanguibacter antarcticus TaxID=372484 RepID=A0A2A9E884_9MICO|nr:carbohydrate ABC transporter permease [Sanguibacter antarcticus]PFG34432.1 carbohydrate ABC transporter membrane protein 2 (CUT1 family) [Sanguibacter antarcticus]